MTKQFIKVRADEVEFSGQKLRVEVINKDRKGGEPPFYRILLDDIEIKGVTAVDICLRVGEIPLIRLEAVDIKTE